MRDSTSTLPAAWTIIKVKSTPAPGCRSKAPRRICTYTTTAVEPAKIRNCRISGELSILRVSHVREQETVRITAAQKKSCAPIAWTTARSTDVQITRSPPRTPCRITRPVADTARIRTQRRESASQVHSASPMIHRPTSAPKRRCPCSASTGPSCHQRASGFSGSLYPVAIGSYDPNELGQSGTARPASILVTTPPQLTRRRHRINPPAA